MEGGGLTLEAWGRENGQGKVKIFSSFSPFFSSCSSCSLFLPPLLLPQDLIQAALGGGGGRGAASRDLGRGGEDREETPRGGEHDVRRRRLRTPCGRKGIGTGLSIPGFIFL